MTSPAVAPYVPFYATRTPYITVAEFLAAPTGADVSQLMPGGTATQNQAALQQLIGRASAWADNLCYKVLAATSDMKVGRYRLTAEGTIKVPLDYTPVLEVTNVAVGYRAGALVTLTDLSGLWIQRKTVEIPITGLASPQGFSSPAVPSRSGRVFAEVTYVNGYPVTTLKTASNAGDTAITPVSVLGIFAGMPLTIADSADVSKTEQVTVAAGYVPGAASVPLTGGLVNAHAAGSGVSALPGDIKDAVISLTTFLVKKRGAEGLVLGSVSGGPADEEKLMPGGDVNYEDAVDILHPYRRVW